MTRRPAQNRVTSTSSVGRSNRKPGTAALQQDSPEERLVAPAPRYYLRRKPKQNEPAGNSKPQPAIVETIKPVSPPPPARVERSSSVNATFDKPNFTAPSSPTLSSPPRSLRFDAGFVDISAWAHYYGYESDLGSDNSSWTPSEMDQTSSVLGSSVPPTETLSRIADQPKKQKQVIDARHSGFYSGLTGRNIDFQATADPERKWLDKILKLNTRPIKSTKKQEENWEADLEHCKQSDEAMFQRTAMMELLDRHQLHNCLNYICETPWTCARMPRRRPEGAPELALPKPDLAVAFKTPSLISEGDLRTLPHLKGCICPEASKEKKDTRAFHFFAMEAKGVDVDKAKSIAYRQNFNTASQALHNMYEIMRRAGEEAQFFERVRVFTVVATAEFFQVRVHRAAKVDKPLKVIPPNYPLEFKFDEIEVVEKHEYTRSKVLSIVHNILFCYGVTELQPILKKALSQMLEKLNEEVETSRKRPAEEMLESFDSSRARLDALDMGESRVQVRPVQLTA